MEFPDRRRPPGLRGHLFSERPPVCGDTQRLGLGCGKRASGVLAGPARAQGIHLRWTRCAAAGIEYYGPALTVNSTRTLGSPSYAGCSTGVCLTLARLRLGTVDITTPAIPPNGNMVTWQGVGPGGRCQAVTAARRSAWGEIKALYR